MIQRYFFAQDNSCHWYVVRAEQRAAWDAWSNLPEDDEAGWACPDYATRLSGGPEAVTFADPDCEAP